MKKLILFIALLISCHARAQIWDGSSNVSFLLAIEDTAVIASVTAGEGYAAPVSTLAAVNTIFSHYTILRFERAYPTSVYAHLRKLWRVDCNSFSLATDLMYFDSTLFSYYEDLGRGRYAAYYPNDWGMWDHEYQDYIHAPDAWSVTKGDPNVIIGITDTYFDVTNPDLPTGKFARIRQNTFHPPMGGGTKEKDHGTLIAGLAAGATDNNYGSTAIGFNCRLDVSTDATAGTFLKMSQDGVKVLNASWFLGVTDTLDYTSRLDEQMVYDEIYENGTMTTVAAANGERSNINAWQFTYPASFDHVFSVSGVGWKYDTGLFNRKGIHETTAGDSFTVCYQHNTRVDLLAPAVQISGLAYSPTDPTLHLQWGGAWGTSCSSPMVAGTFGLMLSANGCLSPYQLEYLIKKNSTQIDTISYNLRYAGATRYKGGRIGAGALDAGKAVIAASSKNFNCGDIPTQTFTIQGIDINTLCVAHLGTLKPKLRVVVANGTPPYTYRWVPIKSGNAAFLDNYTTDTPTVVGLTSGASVLYYRLSVYDNSEVPKEASRIIKMNFRYADTYDLAMQDSYLDMLQEPNEQDLTDPREWHVWAGPDLWNRVADDGMTTHQDPQYFAADSPNYIYTRVRNVGCKASPAGAKLNLYWTKASTGEQWKGDWMDTAKFENPATHIAYQAGGEVTKNTPVLLPAIAPGDAAIISHAWYPPRPQNYNDSLLDADVCLLARIRDGHNPADTGGMTFAEVEHNTTNVKNNNNIATRNTTVWNINGYRWSAHKKVVVMGNAGFAAGNFNLLLATDKFFHKHYGGNVAELLASVTLTLPAAVYTGWAAAGAQGNYTTADEVAHTVTFSPASEYMQLKGIVLAPGQKAPVYLDAVPVAPDSGLLAPQNLNVIQQLVKDDSSVEIYGAVTIAVNVEQYDGQRALAKQAPLQAGAAPMVNSAHFLIYPNPNTGSFTLTTAGYSGRARVWVTDAAGRRVCSLDHDFGKANKLPVTITAYPPGLYLVEVIKADGSRETLKVTKE